MTEELLEKVEINFPKILFMHDHDFQSEYTPLDPRARYIEILKHINRIKKQSQKQSKKISVHWLTSHSFPSVPYIEAISMLSAESMAKEIKYFRFVDPMDTSIDTKRNQFLNLFGHIERGVNDNKNGEDNVQLFVIDDLRDLYGWSKVNNFGLTLFFNTLFRIFSHPNMYLICISKAQVTDWVNQYGNRKVRASFHYILRIQAQVSELDVKFQWLVRPSSQTKLRTEYKKGTDTIVTFFTVPQSFEEYEESGLNLTTVLDYSDVLVCDLNLCMGENQLFTSNKKIEIINTTLNLVLNYQRIAQEERKFEYSDIDNIEYRTYLNSQLQLETDYFERKSRQRSSENERLVNFIKHAKQQKNIVQVNNAVRSDFASTMANDVDRIKSTLDEFLIQLETNKSYNTQIIDFVITQYYELLRLNDDEITAVELVTENQENWLKPFLALYIVTSNSIYSEVRVSIYDNLMFALNHPQIENWRFEYPTSRLYFNTFDTKKAVALAQRIPYTLDILHPGIGISYSKLDSILSQAEVGKLEILFRHDGAAHYILLCQLVLPNLLPIVSSSISIPFSELTEASQPSLPMEFETTIVDIPFISDFEDFTYEIWNIKIIDIEFSEFKKQSDLVENKWTAPTKLKLYISKLDVAVDISKGNEFTYKWKITHPL